MRILFLIAALLLTGCSQKVAYATQSQITEFEARSIFEQVLMEQHPAYRPDVIDFTDEYIWIGKGTRVVGKAAATTAGPNGTVATGSNSSAIVTQGPGERIYYNSIGDTQIYLKRKTYIIKMTYADGRTHRSIIVTSEQKAQRFVDAMNYFRTKTK